LLTALSDNGGKKMVVSQSMNYGVKKAKNISVIFNYFISFVIKYSNCFIIFGIVKFMNKIWRL